MNERVIKFAHALAIGILMLTVMVFTVVQGQETTQQNGNANQSGGQQNRNKHAKSKTSGNTNSSGGQSMNGNMNGNMNGAAMGTNSDAGGKMSRNANGQAGQAMQLSSADRKFVMEAAMGGMAEVEMGRIAAERGASDAVKQFGQKMVDDHSRANNELMQLASGKGITLPTTLDAKHQAVITKMSRLKGADFDRAYAKDMVKDHTQDVALFQREASRGADSDLKGFAQTTLPTLEEHLRMARALPGRNGNGSMNGNMNRTTEK